MKSPLSTYGFTSLALLFGSAHLTGCAERAGSTDDTKANSTKSDASAKDSDDGSDDDTSDDDTSDDDISDDDASDDDISDDDASDDDISDDDVSDDDASDDDISDDDASDDDISDDDASDDDISDDDISDDDTSDDDTSDDDTSDDDISGSGGSGGASNSKGGATGMAAGGSVSGGAGGAAGSAGATGGAAGSAGATDGAAGSAGATGGAAGSAGATGGDSCQPSGMCATGDGLDCTDGAEVARSCDACVLLSSCGGVSCCSGISWVAGNTDTWLERPELVTGFSAGAVGVTLQMTFDGSEQMGAISFVLAEPLAIAPGTLELDLEARGDGILTGAVKVSLEDGNGVGGCVYDLESSGSVWVIDTLSAGCWEDFTSTSLVGQINVRIDSTGSGSGILNVYGLTWSEDSSLGGSCSETCAYPADGECDDGGQGSLTSFCELGTDCTDCGAR